MSVYTTTRALALLTPSRANTLYQNPFGPPPLQPRFRQASCSTLFTQNVTLSMTQMPVKSIYKYSSTDFSGFFLKAVLKVAKTTRKSLDGGVL